MRTAKSFTTLFCIITLGLSSVAPASARPQSATNCYPDVPQWLDDKVNMAVEDVLKSGDSSKLDSYRMELALYTIADAVGGDASRIIRRVPSQANGELLRTEIQV